MEIVVWVSLGLGVGAVIMAAPTVLHLFWGQANLEVAFDRKEYPWGTALICKFFTRPIHNRVWKKLVQHRSIPDSYIHIAVKEAGSMRELTSDIEPEIRASSGRVAQSTGAPFRNEGFRQFSVAVWDREKDGVVSAEEEPMHLPRGGYVAEIAINGKHWSKGFIVGDKEADLRWKED